MMNTSALVLASVMLVGSAVRAWPQTKPAAAAESASKVSVTAVMIEVTVSRYQGDKRISSLPYVLAVTPDGNRSNLRIGGEIAVPSTTIPAAKDGADVKPVRSYGYRPIGTNIDASAVPTEDGRFKVTISLEESSVYAQPDGTKSISTVADAPAFRNLRTSNSLVLRHDQSIEYVVATDRIGNETARINVKLTVVN